MHIRIITSPYDNIVLFDCRRFFVKKNWETFFHAGEGKQKLCFREDEWVYLLLTGIYWSGNFGSVIH